MGMWNHAATENEKHVCFLWGQRNTEKPCFANLVAEVQEVCKVSGKLVPQHRVSIPPCCRSVGLMPYCPALLSSQLSHSDNRMPMAVALKSDPSRSTPRPATPLQWTLAKYLPLRVLISSSVEWWVIVPT